ncbi:MAG: hypothetical protein HKP61_21915 [Dactylosporangium sp.]|nr:hypothetical protein [Dactylosporangium sp.]NNJ63537.1 hypothetical protein [Dactylosporangium sp.]
MGLFSKREKPAELDGGLLAPAELDGGYRGGCAEHNMLGPRRHSVRAAAKDTHDHGRRMHGSPTYPGAYIT